MLRKLLNWIKRILGIKAKEQPVVVEDKVSESKGLSEVSAAGVVETVAEAVAEQPAPAHDEHKEEHVEVKEEVKAEKAE